MPVSANAAARRLCHLSGWTLTDFPLHKILYAAHLYHMGRTEGGLLVSDRWYAIDRGPVVPSLVDITRKFGSQAIKDKFGSEEKFSKPEADILEEFWRRYGKDQNPSDLQRSVSHPASAFARNKVRSRQVPISDRAIFEEYLECVLPNDPGEAQLDAVRNAA
jgi:uncharacterized phage-associated protein